MSEIGNSNRISREFLDSLLIETRYLDSTNPDYRFELYGESFSSPVMTAALSHLEHRLGKDAPEQLANGAKEAGCVLWYGMAEDEEIDRIAKTGVRMIEIIKPYSDRDIIYRKLEQAESLNLLAVGIDIDHPFGEDGSPDFIDDKYEMTAITTSELSDICISTKLPVITKGVLSIRDAERSLAAGARGLVLSHHNNRIEYAVPPLFVLPEIAEIVNGEVPVFVDCEIRTGMDAFKALALGATGVCIGRPLLAALKENKAEGVKDYLLRANGELGKAMAYTGCYNLGRMDPSVIRRI
ncbi:MAG: alpha-hydroxy-acid oxidizing protein [Lachnospiraceae bacterium]|nr:alpha-hydroxy-acid oxidizing protein [Lachnospiraceae bacterium]